MVFEENQACFLYKDTPLSAILGKLIDLPGISCTLLNKLVGRGDATLYSLGSAKVVKHNIFKHFKTFLWFSWSRSHCRLRMWFRPPNLFRFCYNFLFLRLRFPFWTFRFLVWNLLLTIFGTFSDLTEEGPGLELIFGLAVGLALEIPLTVETLSLPPFLFIEILLRLSYTTGCFPLCFLSEFWGYRPFGIAWTWTDFHFCPFLFYMRTGSN